VVRWTRPARLDLKQIRDYIARDSRFYAEKVSLEIVENSEILNSFPEAGRIVPEIGDPNIRELLFTRTVSSNTSTKIEILALIHAKRDFMKQFTDASRQ
jgi:plasmid stabilization system protein ParE